MTGDGSDTVSCSDDTHAGPPPGIPAGFRPLPAETPFQRLFGSLHFGNEGDQLHLGFLIGPDHANRWGHCHGGALAALADMMLVAACRHQAEPVERFSTISLDCDYLAPVPVGSFVTASIDNISRTTNLVFLSSLFHVAGQPVLRASAILRTTGMRTQAEESQV